MIAERRDKLREIRRRNRVGTIHAQKNLHAPSLRIDVKARPRDSIFGFCFLWLNREPKTFRFAEPRLTKLKHAQPRNNVSPGDRFCLVHLSEVTGYRRNHSGIRGRTETAGMTRASNLRASFRTDALARGA